MNHYSPAIQDNMYESNHNFCTGISSNRKRFDKFSPDQLAAYTKSRFKDPVLLAQGHSRAHKNFESGEKSENRTTRVNFKNEFHHKRTSDFDALHKLRKTGNIESQGLTQ